MFAKKLVKWAVLFWVLSLLLLLITAGYFSIIYNGTLVFAGLIILSVTLVHLFGNEANQTEQKSDN